MASSSTVQIPQYQCHKKVRALKIKEVQVCQTEGQLKTCTLLFEDYRFHPTSMDHYYCSKHEPKAGGYLVIYEGGYKSYSPAKEFEVGYSLIED